MCVWRRDRMWEDCVFGDGIGCGKIVCFRPHSMFRVCLFVLTVSTITRCVVCSCVLHPHGVFSARVFCTHTVCSLLVCFAPT